jgi:hypothetical protein
MFFETRHDRNGRVAVITNWRLTQGRLEGFVSGHPGHPDGTYIETSGILSVEGNRVSTRHSEYDLGDPDPNYKKLLESMRLTPEAALHVVAIHNSLRTARFR